MEVIAWTIDAAYTSATRVADPLVGGIPAGSRQAGCRLRFGSLGYLWIATGDARMGTVSQDPTSRGGKVLRVNASTGAGAPDNPSAPSPVYTSGHRNVQGLALRPGTTKMWSVEHGPNVDDEINLLTAGGNSGWDPVPGYNEPRPDDGPREVPRRRRGQVVVGQSGPGDERRRLSGGQLVGRLGGAPGRRVIDGQVAAPVRVHRDRRPHGRDRHRRTRRHVRPAADADDRPQRRPLHRHREWRRP